MKYLLISICLLGSIAAQAQTNYHENLSNERIHFEDVQVLVKDTLQLCEDTVVTPTNQQNKDADAVVDGLKTYYDEFDKVKGKRILIYSGDSETEADQKKAEVAQTLEELYGIDHGVYYDKDWNSPAWRVVVGCFKDKLDAYRVYVKIKEKFPRALIIPDNRIPKDCIQ